MANAINTAREVSLTLRIFCAGAARSAFGSLTTAFEQASQIKLEFTLGPVGALVKRIHQGEVADVLVLARPALMQLAEEGRVVAETIRTVGSVGMGLVQPKGAPPIRASAVDELRATLLAASSVAYGDPARGDSSGLHMAHVLETLGIVEQMRDKSILEPMGLAVAETVAQGRAEIGITQISVIRARSDVQLAAPLPDELQHITTYAMGLSQSAPPSAGRFLHFFHLPEARRQFVNAGFAAD